MKRGFLNTEKAKAKLAAETPDVPTDVHKGKKKAKTETVPTDINHLDSRPPLLDLHSVPSSVKTAMEYPEDKNRFIFLHWPRDPNGKPILPSDIHGKEAGNGLDLWGATLYDFYYVHRLPSIENAVTISTGSKLTKVMKALGELDHAKDQLDWATRETDPVEIPAWDPAEAIVAHERRVQAGAGSRQDTVEEAKDPALKDSVNEPSGKFADLAAKARMQQPPLEIPEESPFHPSHYPSPWPLVPFESPSSLFALQRGIPIHLLPKKLYVHDPWKLTNSDDPDAFHEDSESWTSKTDHVRTYTLSLPLETQSMADAASEAAVAAAAEDEALKDPETVFIPPQETEGPTKQPAIRAFLPKRPRKPITVPEAHLYLSPKSRLGTGNHSIVYEAELELPRDLFCESTYCKSCLDEQVKVEVDRLKESGEWERRLSEAANEYETTRPRDSPSPSPVQIPPHYVGFVKVIAEHVPMQKICIVTPESKPNASSEHYLRASDSVINRHIDYHGPIIPIHPNIQWQNPSFPQTICVHEVGTKKPVPRTATFRVAAKLSLPGDVHLEREARNYLRFPAHFFQHWSGYNVIPPLHDPTPVGAVVPQFFGYYKPDTPPGSGSRYEYCSPILLIEHCGKPIRVKELSTDDRHECAALLFRFHAAGWLHESFAERNIVMQNHHPTCTPLGEHQCDLPHQHRRYSFRLIDFGRSVPFNQPLRRCGEEMTGKQLFGIP